MKSEEEEQTFLRNGTNTIGERTSPRYIRIWLVTISIIFMGILFFLRGGSQSVEEKSFFLFDDQVQGELKTFMTAPISFNIVKSENRLYGPIDPGSLGVINSLQLQFNPAESDLHHMIIYAGEFIHSEAYLANEPAKWHSPSVAHLQETLFAYAHNQEEVGVGNDVINNFTLPNDVAFFIGKKKIFLECHFEVKEIQQKVKRNVFTLGLSLVGGKEASYLNPVGVSVLYRDRLKLPSGKEDVRACMKAKAVNDVTIFAFRTHAHSAGREIDTVLLDSDSREISRELVQFSSQEAQIFYKLDADVHVLKGETLYGICHFDTRGRDFVTTIGLDPEKKEMCNQYLMYKTTWNDKSEIDLLWEDGNVEDTDC
eukprot:snap_masked-scaffold_11-processed-gene-12.52-mRNA-1 protein AED:1.00 eAED:1.00 QI:0/-1/0/0/-1/1/1/0/368